MSNQFVVVTESYSIEAVIVPRVAPATEHPERPLPWRQIGVGALLGAVLGLIATATIAGIDSLAVAIACGIDVAAGGAIIGALWAATFCTADED